MNGRRPGVGSRLGRDRGAASIFVLAVGLLLVAAGVAAAAVGVAGVGRRQARNAADLGALAGAMWAVYGEPAACGRAGRFVTANGGRMTACTVSGLEIVVRAEVEVRPLPGLIRHVSAAARAGPVSSAVLPGREATGFEAAGFEAAGFEAAGFDAAGFGAAGVGMFGVGMFGVGMGGVGTGG